jgi:redox-sensing transcriptional repressor
MNMEDDISPAILRRLPVYRHYLLGIRESRKNVSASMIAAHFGLNDVQVRKDLGIVSGTGRPKTGYDVEQLIGQIEKCLGCRDVTDAILVGAGNLGRALLSYSGFSDYGLNILAAFDTDPALVHTVINGKIILPAAEMEPFCFEKGIRLGIIATPVNFAQSVCDRLISCGVKALWNFAPTILKTPEGVLVENENLASSLAILSKHLRAKAGE